MINNTKNTKIDNNEENVVSPTQAQMDEWVQKELAEADQDEMLSSIDDANLLFSGEEPTDG